MKYTASVAAIAVAMAALTSAAVAQDKPTIAFVVNGPSDFWKLTEAGVATAQGELRRRRHCSSAIPSVADAAMQQRRRGRSRSPPASTLSPFRSWIRRPRPTRSTSAAARFRTSPSTRDAAAVQPRCLFRFVQRRARQEGRRADEDGHAGKRRQVHGLRRSARCRQCHGTHRRATMKPWPVPASSSSTSAATTSTRPAPAPTSMTCSLPIPTVNCMVGFYSYNPPRIYEALRDAGKLGPITVVGFDEDPITLGAVKEGSFAGTVVQQPFEWGYAGLEADRQLPQGRQVRRSRPMASSSSRASGHARTTSTPFQADLRGQARARNRFTRSQRPQPSVAPAAFLSPP